MVQNAYIQAARISRTAPSRHSADGLPGTSQGQMQSAGAGGRGNWMRRRSEGFGRFGAPGKLSVGHGWPGQPSSRGPSAWTPAPISESSPGWAGGMQPPAHGALGPNAVWAGDIFGSQGGAVGYDGRPVTAGQLGPGMGRARRGSAGGSVGSDVPWDGDGDGGGGGFGGSARRSGGGTDDYGPGGTMTGPGEDGRRGPRRGARAYGGAGGDGVYWNGGPGEDSAGSPLNGSGGGGGGGIYRRRNGGGGAGGGRVRRRRRAGSDGGGDSWDESGGDDGEGQRGDGGEGGGAGGGASGRGSLSPGRGGRTGAGLTLWGKVREATADGRVGRLEDMQSDINDALRLVAAARAAIGNSSPLRRMSPLRRAFPPPPVAAPRSPARSPVRIGDRRHPAAATPQHHAHGEADGFRFAISTRRPAGAGAGGPDLGLQLSGCSSPLHRRRPVPAAHRFLPADSDGSETDGDDEPLDDAAAAKAAAAAAAADGDALYASRLVQRLRVVTRRADPAGGGHSPLRLTHPAAAAPPTSPFRRNRPTPPTGPPGSPLRPAPLGSSALRPATSPVAHVPADAGAGAGIDAGFPTAPATAAGGPRPPRNPPPPPPSHAVDAAREAVAAAAAGGIARWALARGGPGSGRAVAPSPLAAAANKAAAAMAGKWFCDDSDAEPGPRSPVAFER
jgi:hypothetical protein